MEMERQHSLKVARAQQQGSKWLQTISKDQLANELTNHQKQQERKERLAALLAEESGDDDLRGNDFEEYLDKVQKHLHAENKMIEVWREEQTKGVSPQKKKGK